MTAQRFQCPAAPYIHPKDRHMVTERRWTLTGPTGVETTVCSLACVITVACRWLTADVNQEDGRTKRTAEKGAAA
jgi:hypothetical protein